MDEALVQNAEHDVDDEDREREDPAQAAQRFLERLRGALEAARHRARQRLARELLDARDRIAERDAGRDVERERDRRQLADVVDRLRADALARA